MVWMVFKNLYILIISDLDESSLSIGRVKHVYSPSILPSTFRSKHVKSQAILNNTTRAHSSRISSSSSNNNRGIRLSMLFFIFVAAQGFVYSHTCSYRCSLNHAWNINSSAKSTIAPFIPIPDICIHPQILTG